MKKIEKREIKLDKLESICKISHAENNISFKMNEAESNQKKIIFHNTNDNTHTIQEASKEESNSLHHYEKHFGISRESESNTCYINAAIQMLLSITPIYDLIKKYHQQQKNPNSLLSKIGSLMSGKNKSRTNAELIHFLQNNVKNFQSSNFIMPLKYLIYSTS